MTIEHRPRYAGICVLIAGSWACTTVRPSEPEPADPNTASAEVSAISRAPSSPIDPAQQWERLRARLSRPDLRVATSIRRDGGRAFALDGAMQHAMIAVRGPDGQVRTTCVDTAEAAARLLSVAPGTAAEAP